MTEMMSSHATIAGTMDCPEEELTQAIYNILLVQFHDILPGSSVQSAVEKILRVLDHAIEIFARVKARARFGFLAKFVDLVLQIRFRKNRPSLFGMSECTQHIYSDSFYPNLSVSLNSVL